ncbi:MAG TPA: tRNA (adenosine(37)-N6)-threonylcarbamoyltransferase complex dimerization subunit type 1 TsaB [Alphaproteobacteria bacterium]|nr:tRNA (adenosine(37)-N6)-threonylcarbamoyltransferase complex dimerization subunit type 1 TsaB [Alphaproteobacteria bacterium]
MIVLAFDTACDACSAAVWQDGELRAQEFAAMARGQSEALMPMIARVMALANVGFADLAGIGVTNGPGAFTGLRIGLAAARAMALASAKPAIGVTTLEAIAAAANIAGELVVAIDAKREDLYLQRFANGAPAESPYAALPGAFVAPAGPYALAGDGAARLFETLPQETRARVSLLAEPRLPDAAVVARLAAERLAAGVDIASPRPLYLRPPDAKLPQDGGRVKVMPS